MAGISVDACVVLNSGIKMRVPILLQKITGIEQPLEPFRMRPAMPRQYETRSCDAGAADWPGPATGPASRCPAARASCARARNAE
ncbi:hypothetical protein DIE06_33650 [Burkholderia sp. Bp8998]|nr:hypothetical protein DIE06_33650 [Burkholderia sp. Bp8998]